MRPLYLAVAVMLLLAAPVQGQFASAGVGMFHNNFVTDPVAEVVIGSPEVGGFRATLVGSWTLEPFGAKPYLIPRIGRDLYRHKRFLLGAGAGAVFVPGHHYKHPHATVAARLFVLLPAGFRVVTIGSVEPWHDQQSLVVKLDRVLWGKR